MNKRIFTIVLLLLCLALNMCLSACMMTASLDVKFDSSHSVYEEDSLDSLKPYLTVRFINSLGMVSTVKNYTLSGTLSEGECTIYVKYGGLARGVKITVLPKEADGDDDGSGAKVTITLSFSKTFIEKNDTTDMTVSVTPSNYESQVQYKFIQGEDCVTRNGVSFKGDSSGIVQVQAYIDDYTSNVASFQIVDPDEDPYKNINANQFYNNYNPATSLEDSYWRTKHNLMSGSIDNQNQAPTVASNQPKSGNNLVRNSDSNFIDNGNTYCVVDSSNNVVNKIYKFGAYVTLEDVAAYVYAFGDIPANYDSDKDNKDASSSSWGQYLRVNHSRFYNNNSGDFAYEPKLPEAGPGGTMQYYELDIGTTGYNNGTKITRGTARIVYTRYYANGKLVDDLEYRYVFYTYNHYNDFQEYLNYQGGWGERFGNVSNGGTLDKGSNPSPYVDVSRQSFNALFK